MPVVTSWTDWGPKGVLKDNNDDSVFFMFSLEQMSCEMSLLFFSIDSFHEWSLEKVSTAQFI